MRIEVWYDYICPWCYAALDRASYLEQRHVVEVTWQPFELHPDWPADGKEAPRDERAGILRELVAETGLPFTGRRTVTNSLAALSVSSHLAHRSEWPRLHRRIFEAYWVDGRNLGDSRTLIEIGRQVGIDAADVEAGVESGVGAVFASKERALELGIAATPGWHFGNGVVFPGVHEPAVFDRIISRLADTG